MKTFKDLEFKPHPNIMMGFKTMAKLNFSNGYGVSVITGRSAYGSGNNKYECAVTRNGDLCYTTPITEDVVGHCDEEMVTEIMKQIQKLPKKEQNVKNS